MKRQAAAVAFAIVAAIVAGQACNTKAAFDKEAAIRRGDAAVAAKQWRRAIGEYRSVIQYDRSEVQTRLKLAEALRQVQQWQAAAHEVIAAADIAPGDRDVQLLAIEAMNGQSRFDDALDRVAPLIKAEPDNRRLLLIHANAKAKVLNNVWVIWRLGESLRLGQSYEAALFHIRSRNTQSEDQDAEASYRRAAEVAPADIEVAAALAGFLWASGRPDEGRDILVKAANRDPGNALIGRALGLLLIQLDSVEEGERYLRRSAASGDADSQLALADLLGRTERIDEALTILKPFTNGEDADERAVIRTADLELRRGKPAAALALADAILSKVANHAEALRIKADALVATGAAATALPIARSAVAVSPTSGAAHLALARALDATGDLGSAFDEYSEAWRSNTRNPAVAKALAKVALALSRHGIAVNLANQSLRLKPGDPEAVAILVRGTLRLGKVAAAERALAPFITTKATSAEIIALEGEIQAAKGRLDLARTAFLKALQLKPGLIEALEGLVAAELKAGNIQSAKLQIDQALSKRPKDPSLLLLVAKVAMAEKNLARAESALRQILDADAGREEPAVLLATVLGEQGRQKEAQASLEKAIGQQPRSSRLRFMLAAAFEDQGQFAEAQVQYEKVMSDNQLSGANAAMLDAYNEASARLAALFADQGWNLDEALPLASSAKRHRPDDPAFSDTLGWVHVRKDRARLGVPFLEAAVKAEPANRLFRYHLAAAHEQLGDIDKARAELARALEGNPRFRGVDAARALQKSLAR